MTEWLDFLFWVVICLAVGIFIVMGYIVYVIFKYLGPMLKRIQKEIEG